MSREQLHYQRCFWPSGDLPGLCANTPKRTGVARTKESAGLEPQGLGRVDLWRHLPSESVLGPMQCAATRIDS